MKIASKKPKHSKIHKSSKQKTQEPSNHNQDIEDSRFQSVHYDPKFLPASKKISKTAIDSRFSELFNDKRFKIVSEKDKYGREINLPETNQDMEKLYYLPDEGKEEVSKPKVKKTHKKKEKNDKNDKKAEKTMKIKKTEEIHNKYYNEQGKFDWNEESSSEDSEEVIEQDTENVWEDDEVGVVRNESTSNKLALLNYDWMNINSEDLMVLFNSLKPKNAVINQIIVYPSEFGLKRLEKENKEGPADIWENEEKPEEQQENQGKTKEKHKKVEKEVNDWIAKVNKPTEFDPIKLRRYEKDRLKYYYAIIECDTKETAEHIYNECDGTEFELSGMKIDLRFVPEQQEFPYPAKETCDFLPISNKVNNFLNRALNHTNVELTWENPNMNRFDYLYNKNMTEEDWNKIDYSKILGDKDEDIEISIDEDIEANDDDGDDDNKGKVKTKVNITKDWRSDFDKKNRRNIGDEEMEIKFSSGFVDIGNKMNEKKKEKEESTWEKYLKKRKEKKKAKKLLEKKKMTEDDYFVEPEAADDRDEEKYEDELNLLVDDEKEKDFNVDIKDDRFKAIYEDSKYGINPTHKDFTVDGSGKYLKEVVDRRKKSKKNL